MAKIIKDNNTVLVIGAVPYSLVKNQTCEPIVVCDKCDLRDMCCKEDGQTLLIDLCMNCNRSSAWYFKEDWDIEDYGIKDYLDATIKDYHK